MVREIRILPLEGLPEIVPGDDLASLLGDAIDRSGGLEEGDVVVLAHKIVSKAEGRVEKTADHRDVVVREARRIRRRRDDFIIAETEHGFVCANAGVDRSNAPAEGMVVLLPRDPDSSATELRQRLAARFDVVPAVIITDSFGRPWRLGTTDVAIGVAGLRPLRDLRGTTDTRGYELEATVVAVADELAGAAELVVGQATGIPAAIVRGAKLPVGEGTARDLVMPPGRDLFP